MVSAYRSEAVALNNLGLARDAKQVADQTTRLHGFDIDAVARI